MSTFNNCLASLGVAALFIFLIFADFHRKKEAVTMGRVAARKRLLRNHRSEWDLTSVVRFGDAARFVGWVEMSRVPSGAIPIAPSYLPAQAKESIRRTVEEVIDAELKRLNLVERDAGEYQLYGQFVVASGPARNAQAILSQPVFGATDAASSHVPNELQMRLNSLTEFAFADFLLTGETADPASVEKLTFRLWYDYADREWRLTDDNVTAAAGDRVRSSD